MLTVSEPYAAAIIPAVTDARETTVRVTVKALADPVEAEVTDSETPATHSREAQVINGVYNTRYRYACAEPNCWLLDGSTVLQPDVGQDAEVGYVSDEVSDINGDYSAPPYVEITIDPAIAVKGISVFFDLLDNEYATDFTIVVSYGSSETDTVNVTGNTKAVYNLVQEYADVTMVSVTIDTWSAAYKHAKITEVGFGLAEQFGSELENPLLSVSCTDEVDITTETLPFGELVFEFYDTNNDFSVLTPTDRTKVFTEGTNISVEIGVRVADGSFEFALAGTYRFAEWGISRSRVVNVRAVDLIGFIGPKTPLEEFGGRSKIAPYNAVVSFMEAADLDLITNVEVDLATFPNTGTDFLDGPYADYASDQLIRLAQWSQTIPIVGSDGVLRFVEIGSTPLKVIDYANLFDSPQMTRYDQVLGIRVYYYDVAVSTDITEIATTTGAFGAGTTLIFDVGYDYEVYDVVAAGGATLESTTGFAFGKYTLEASGTGTITVRGKRWVIGKQFVESPNTLATDPKAVWVEVDNPHICTSTRASDVADWLLAIYGRLAEVDFGWRGTPEVETLDVIDLEPQDGTQVDSIILKHEWSHNGVLRYQTKGAAMWLH